MIAYLVKELRTHDGWKQLALAPEAGINVKTVERIEAGERVSDETLDKVAKALKPQPGALTHAHYRPSDKELAEMVRKAKEDYTHTDLYDLESVANIDRIISAQAHLIDDGAIDDALADRVASLKDYVQDAMKIYGDAQHTNRLAFCRNLLEAVRDIEEHGYKARWTRYATADDFQVGVLVFLKPPPWKQRNILESRLSLDFCSPKPGLAGK